MERQPPFPSSPPPPYSTSEPQKQSPRIVKFNPKPSARGDPDLEICSHPHELLVSINTTGHDPSSVLHYWDFMSTETPIASSLAIPTSLSPNSLQHVRGFRDLGTCWMPAIETSDTTRLHRYLTSLIFDESDQKSSVTSDASIFCILKHLHGASFSSQDIPVQLVVISVLSNSTDALFTGGPFPLWKWAKPESVYGELTLSGVLAGRWETDVEKAIVHGEWRGGKELHLLMHGVSEETGEELSQSDDTLRFINTQVWRKVEVTSVGSVSP